MCPRPIDLPLLSKEPTREEMSLLDATKKQNGVLWVECASKVNVFIKEAQECTD